MTAVPPLASEAPTVPLTLGHARSSEDVAQQPGSSGAQPGTPAVTHTSPFACPRALPACSGTAGSCRVPILLTRSPGKWRAGEAGLVGLAAPYTERQKTVHGA